MVVVLSGSMEPGFYRGDILFLYMGRRPLQAGEVRLEDTGHFSGTHASRSRAGLETPTRRRGRLRVTLLPCYANCVREA